MWVKLNPTKISFADFPKYLMDGYLVSCIITPGETYLNEEYFEYYLFETGNDREDFKYKIVSLGQDKPFLDLQKTIHGEWYVYK